MQIRMIHGWEKTDKRLTGALWQALEEGGGCVGMIHKELEALPWTNGCCRRVNNK